MRNLIVIFGDQLDREACVFHDFDKSQDVIWMAEVEHESKHVWSHKQRIAVFLSAMRHFCDALQNEGFRVEYTQLDDRRKTSTFSERLRIDLRCLKPKRVMTIQPGEWRVLEMLKKVCKDQNVALEVKKDTHFYTSVADFSDHAKGRKSLRMEYFYRELRKRFDVLMDGDKPVGGQWNYDRANRQSFDQDGPQDPHEGPKFKPDSITTAVIDLVNERFADHPGALDSFAWPVTAKEARELLREFINVGLPRFGAYQDAMWTDEPWLYHSLISSSMNLKLLNPREAIAAAVKAYKDGDASLAAVEGFVRQILGWREYVRNVYWMEMPRYQELNEMNAHQPLPDFYWDGNTDLECLKQAIGQTLQYGYAHHIQRLMVTGLYALLLGVDPKRVHEWYLAVYVDAVEWVELPNTLGMSQYADGGLMASKPYIATGNYINKMSNYCASCPKNPNMKTGEQSCPFTTLYWDYLMRHRQKLKNNRRMSLQIKNIDRLNEKERRAIAREAEKIRGNPAL